VRQQRAREEFAPIGGCKLNYKYYIRAVWHSKESDLSPWPKGPFAEVVADEIWDTVSGLDRDVLPVGKPADRDSPLTARLPDINQHAKKN
jgi:hypothetical protein